MGPCWVYMAYAGKKRIPSVGSLLGAHGLEYRFTGMQAHEGLMPKQGLYVLDLIKELF